MTTGILVLVALSLCATPALEQPVPAGCSTQPVASEPHNLRQALSSVRIEPDRASNRGQVGIVVGGAAGRPGPSGLRGVLIRLAVLGGLVGGGALGAAIEGDRCQCDDPGLTGFVIGAPIGAFAAGILVWNLTK